MERWGPNISMNATDIETSIPTKIMDRAKTDLKIFT